MTRPVVGVTTSLQEMTSDGWTELTAGTPATYVAAVQRAGGRAVLLPPDEETTDALDGLDALIVSGAAGDTDPSHYGAEPHPKTHPVEPSRDRFELGVTRAALERSLPVLGVCRGMHVLNVALGGTLEQHLPDVLGHGDHAGAPGVFAQHDVRLEHGRSRPAPWARRARGSRAITTRACATSAPGCGQPAGRAATAWWRWSSWTTASCWASSGIRRRTTPPR